MYTFFSFSKAKNRTKLYKLLDFLCFTAYFGQKSYKLYNIFPIFAVGNSKRQKYTNAITAIYNFF